MKKRLFAGFAALCMAASLASAAFAETATPETARAASPQVVEYQASDDDTGFSASAEAAPGVLPDGAALTVTPLDDTAAPEEVTDYGERAAALDLTFKNAQGAEVEPEGGTVKVTVQLTAIAEALQQAENPTLVHRVEQADGTTTAEKVESAVFAEDRTQVSFETDSFSVYEIYATVPQDADSDKSDQVDTYATGGYDYQGKAAIYYLDDPTGDPDSPATKGWAPETDKSELFATVDLKNRTWTDEDKKTWDDPSKKYIESNIANYITWPDGTTGGTWTVNEDTTITGWTDSKTPFEYIRDSIFAGYKSMLVDKFEVTDLEEKDVTEITLTAHKITNNVGGSDYEDQQHHVDCTIDIKCNGVFTAKFWVKEPGATEYPTLYTDAKNYKAGSRVEKTQKVKIGSTVEKDGITYVLTGWYPENDKGVARKDTPIDEKTGWPYTPSETELKDGTVNFYAEYVPMYQNVTVTKTVTGTLGDKTKDFGFTLNVTNNGTTVSGNITGTKTKQNGETEKLSVRASSGTFTLKDSESITFTNIPYGATVTVTEDNYTQKTGDATPYTTSYIVDNGAKQTGLEATISNVTADHTIAFTNSKDVIPDTGITLNSMPYLLVLAGVLVGGLAWMRRRKRS